LAERIRCICVNNQTPENPFSIPCPKQSSSSSSHEKASFTQCHGVIPIKYDESWKDYFKRLGARGDELHDECCCPENDIKYVTSPHLSGYEKNIYTCGAIDFFASFKKNE
jgi:hypothetical protein